MESLKNLYLYGPGPSSSHTLGPYLATLDFLKRYPDLDSVKVELYGSLALTGKGHGTDTIIKKVLAGYNCQIIFNPNLNNLPHPNTMLFEGYKEGRLICSHKYFSLGGGMVSIDEVTPTLEHAYPHHSFKEINAYMEEHQLSDLAAYVDEFEDVNDFLNEAVERMFSAVEEGLNSEGYLPGEIHLNRVAKQLYGEAVSSIEEERMERILIALSYASAEVNASGGNIVLAPTAGSCGILPAILYYSEHYLNHTRQESINALKVASIFGNLARENATIAGAQGGCQAEIGVASSMGAAAIAYLNHLPTRQVEHAAEIALEHFLGLTCDPVLGYVQIPCIERNAIGTLRAYNAYLIAKAVLPHRQPRVSYDEVLQTMKETGEALSKEFKETAKGGLAKTIGAKC